ncbi:MAG: hypothetical protein QXU60_05735 [Sulfolobales archaeon]
MNDISSALAVLGAMFIIYSLISIRWSVCVISIFLGSLLLGTSIAIKVEPMVGLAVIIIYSGGLTALTYIASILLSRREIEIKTIMRLVEVVALPLLISTLFSITLLVKDLESRISITTPVFSIGSLDITSLSIALVMSVGVIIILLGGGRR